MCTVHRNLVRVYCSVYILRESRLLMFSNLNDGQLWCETEPTEIRRDGFEGVPLAMSKGRSFWVSK
jgi:hypothetical protein